ncbi:uncharacterized protein NPIL_429871 [Nephila pilipes]|uniref:Uncharacterized protein n=1 Tax=Nephila pilipes TaxID=299642 RepID=A0A8X6TCV5_NEPPI|nr:uncharacterized protein NPIL_481001 [Nephila pilipes]GFT63394.1 uncharacterized protein NPIL_429871 [Nephila pilipes]
MDSAFRTVQKCRRPNEKFNSEEAIFQVIVDPDRRLMSNGAPTIGQTTDAIRTLFETLLRRATRILEPTDLMRVIIFSDHLDRTISTHLMLVSEMSVEKIMACAVRESVHCISSKNRFSDFDVSKICNSRPFQ